jgi:tripartite-type tricarboxylate transporter receptor subunit TctC
MELLKRRCALDVLHVPYRGMPGLLPELLAGRIDLAVADTVSAAPGLGTGDIRALTVLQGTRSAAFPGVPTTAELGCGDIETGGWLGVCVAAGTPPDIVERLGASLRRAIATEPVAVELRGLGARMAGAGPREFDALVRVEAATWRPLIRELGLRPDR